ncbi:MAG: response regulator transcription factor [Proteobacteria bacterium]|nr:response regulator transcription factor [Pseudomonadota bacterium]
MEYTQTSEILFGTSSVPTRELVMSAQWPRHLTLTCVKSVVDSLAKDFDASDYDCLIMNDQVESVSLIRGMGVTLPIVSLIQGTNASARIAAFQAGADDCLGPVFAISELIVRTEALCRRTSGQNLRTRVRDSHVSLSVQTQVATLNGKTVTLTMTESLILRLFLENQNRLLSASQVARHVWGEDNDASNNLVCVHIANLRRKMATLPWPQPIRTIRGRGYMLSPPD